MDGIYDLSLIIFYSSSHLSCVILFMSTQRDLLNFMMSCFCFTAYLVILCNRVLSVNEEIFAVFASWRFYLALFFMEHWSFLFILVSTDQGLGS